MLTPWVRDTPLSAAVQHVDLSVLPAGVSGLLSGVVTWVTCALHGVTSLWPSMPTEDALRLAVQVVPPNDQIDALPLPGRSRGSSGRVTVGFSVLPLVLDASRPQHAACFHQLGVSAHVLKGYVVSGVTQSLVSFRCGHPAASPATLQTEDCCRSVPDRGFRHVPVKQRGDTQRSPLSLHLEVLEVRLLPCSFPPRF